MFTLFSESPFFKRNAASPIFGAPCEAPTVTEKKLWAHCEAKAPKGWGLGIEIRAVIAYSLDPE